MKIYDMTSVRIDLHVRRALRMAAGRALPRRALQVAQAVPGTSIAAGRMGRSRRASMGATLAALLLGMTALASTPVHAATVSIAVDCTGPIQVTANIGDTLVFTFQNPGCDDYNSLLDNTNGTDPGFLSYVSDNSNGDLFEDTGSGWTYLGGSPPSNLLNRWKYDADGSPIEVTVILSAINVNGDGLANGGVIGQLSPGTGTYNITWVSPGGGAEESSAPSVPMQGVPLPSSGSCADVDEAQLTWGATIKGGWTKSWQPWVNPTAPEHERGGFACIRNIRWTSSGWTAT